MRELKQPENTIRHCLTKARELADLKSRFISMTSHEFRTPLTVILSSAALLENYGHQWDEGKKMIHLQRIQIAGRRITYLLDNISLLSRAESNKLQYQPISINLPQFCQELVADLHLMDNEQHLINFTCSGQSANTCMDKKALQEIFHNLLSNALKYSPVGSVIDFKLRYDENLAVFQVRDQGIGIPPIDLPHVFESFHRGNNVGTISGTGLGLAIVKKYVDLQGGTITVTSEEGVGTLFVVRLPTIPTH